MAALSPQTAAAFLALGLLTLLPSPATAEKPREHDRFFLRLSAGAGRARTGVDNARIVVGDLVRIGDIEWSGPAGDVNFAIGGMVARNLALHGTLAGWSISDADIEFDGESRDTRSDMSLSILGAGLTYYVMPANVYFSGSVGAAVLTLEDENSDTGVGVDLTVGKEWWVGQNWGLGGSIGATLHSVPAGDGSGDDFTGSSFAVRFSATLN